MVALGWHKWEEEGLYLQLAFKTCNLIFPMETKELVIASLRELIEESLLVLQSFIQGKEEPKEEHTTN